MITAHGSVETAVEAMKAGAFHYLTKPFPKRRGHPVGRNGADAAPPAAGNLGLRRELANNAQLAASSASPPEMQAVYRMIEQVAPARTTVLITGESGTGKELDCR